MSDKQDVIARLLNIYETMSDEGLKAIYMSLESTKSLAEENIRYCKVRQGLIEGIFATRIKERENLGPNAVISRYSFLTSMPPKVKR